MAILIAFIGLAFTGITSALAVNSATIAFTQTQYVEGFKEGVHNVITPPEAK
ncbi:MAG: hypothetical protein ACJAVV_003796 [Alphaproteobacteria bacterium]